jgi:TonB family protein
MVGAMTARLSALLLVSLMVMALPARPQNGSEGRSIEKYAVKRVVPQYPPLARQYRIEGTVVVRISVGGDGKVAKADFVRGHNIFRSVSLDAAKRWEFKVPNNEPLEGIIRFVFKLSE